MSGKKQSVVSSKLSAKVHASQTKIKMPQCTWAAAGADGSSALLATKESDAPLGVDARRASLQAIASSRSDLALLLTTDCASSK